jgi:hypothetical protein
VSNHHGGPRSSERGRSHVHLRRWCGTASSCRSSDVPLLPSGSHRARDARSGGAPDVLDSRRELGARRQPRPDASEQSGRQVIQGRRAARLDRIAEATLACALRCAGRHRARAADDERHADLPRSAATTLIVRGPTPRRRTGTGQTPVGAQRHFPLSTRRRAPRGPRNPLLASPPRPRRHMHVSRRLREPRLRQQ